VLGLSWLCLVLPALAAGPLAEPGETLGGAEVVDVERHPEYQRVRVALEDERELVLEVTRAIEQARGACEHHGLVVQPRWDLLEEEVALEDQPPPVTALCGRLAERGEGLVLAPPGRVGSPPVLRSRVDLRRTEPGEVAPPLPPQPLPWRPLHGVLLALGLAGVLAVVGPLRRAWRGLAPLERQDLVGVTLLGVVVRALLSPAGLAIWNGHDRVVLSWGLTEGAQPFYGDGFAALMTGAWPFSIPDPFTVFRVNAVLAVAAVPLAWALGRQVAPRAHRRVVALVTGVVLALWAPHVRLSVSEVQHISVLTFELLAVVGALHFARTSSWTSGGIAALAGGLVVHLRPETIAFPAALLAVVALERRERLRLPPVLGSLGLLLLVATPRWLAWSTLSGGASAARSDRLLELATWGKLLRPGWGALDSPLELGLVVLHLGLTPPVCLLLVLVGLVSRRWRCLGWSGVWAVVSLVPVAAKSWPTVDALRLQLPGAGPWVVWIALGAGCLASLAASRTRWSRPRLAVGLVALLAAPHLTLAARPWTATTTWSEAARLLPALPDRTLLLVPDHTQRHEELVKTFAQLMGWRGDGSSGAVLGLSDFLAAPPPWEGRVVAWLGPLCSVRFAPTSDSPPAPSPCPALEASCELEELESVELPAFGDGNVHWVGDTVSLRLVRVRGCDGG